MIRQASQILLFLGIAASIYTGLHIVGSTRHPYSNHLNRLEMYAECDNFESVKVGNSHVGGLNFEVLGEHGFSPFIGGSDIFEAVHQAKTAVQRCGSLNTVYIVVSPFFFLTDNSVLKDFADIRKRNYACNPSWRLIDGDIRNAVRGRMAPVVRADNWQSFLWKKPELVKHEFDFSDDAVPNLDDHASMRAKKMSKTLRKLRKAGCCDQRHAANYFEDFVRWVLKTDVKLVLFTPVYYYRYTEEVNKVLGKEAVGFRDSVLYFWERKYGIEYYDLTADSKISQNTEYFLNSDHVNLSGSIEVTRLFQEIRNKKRLSPERFENNND